MTQGVAYRLIPWHIDSVFIDPLVSEDAYLPTYPGCPPTQPGFFLAIASFATIGYLLMQIATLGA